MGDRGCPEPPVDAQMQAELGARGEIAVDLLSTQVHDHDLFGREAAEQSAGRADRDVLAGADRYVPGASSDKPFRSKSPRGRGDSFTLALEHRSTRAPP
jgi:hypothetical protein